MTDETTTEQLAEIEGQATEYTPPDGWRVLQAGETISPGDQWVRPDDGRVFASIRSSGIVLKGTRYLRRIEPEPQPKPQSQSQPEPEPQPQAATIEELRSEVSYVQNLLGESRQRVTELEELVSSLRTINEAQEKAVEAAGKENTALRNQLLAVKTELASVAADRQRLRIELDAAQQVPADSPEMRQLRADLAEVTLDRDQCKDAYTQLFAFVETVRETAKARAVETIAEWTEPFRRCGSERLAWMVMQNLPHIMRTLTGLTPED